MDYSNDAKQERNDEHCTICGKVIETMTWRGTGVCGDVHRKEAGVVIMGEDRADKG